MTQVGKPMGFANILILALLAALATLVIAKAVVLTELEASGQARDLTDFDVFHVAARMVWRGETAAAYAATTMTAAQKTLANGVGLLPWAYPPQFMLAIAPLGKLPLGLAALVFLALPLAAFLMVLKRLAGPDFGFALAASFPALILNALIGQNGYLSGALIGWACLLLLRGEGTGTAKNPGGLPLGLMVFKPHLAIPFAVEALVRPRPRVIMTALATVALTSLAATAVFGPAIWPAFRTGVTETSAFLSSGAFPLFRMVSTYAVIRSLGAPAGAAMAVHAVFALVLLGMVVQATRRKLPLRQVLGLSALASPFISPYAYLYDLPAYGIGVALLAPDLKRLASRAELAAFLALSVAAGGAGYLQPKLFPSDTYDRISVAGAITPLIFGLVWRILKRDRPSLTER